MLLFLKKIMIFLVLHSLFLCWWYNLWTSFFFSAGLQEIFQFNAFSDECILVRCKIMQCRKLVKVEQLRSHVTGLFSTLMFLMFFLKMTFFMINLLISIATTIKQELKSSIVSQHYRDIVKKFNVFLECKEIFK